MSFSKSLTGKVLEFAKAAFSLYCQGGQSGLGDQVCFSKPVPVNPWAGGWAACQPCRARALVSEDCSSDCSPCSPQRCSHSSVPGRADPARSELPLLSFLVGNQARRELWGLQGPPWGPESRDPVPESRPGLWGRTQQAANPPGSGLSPGPLPAPCRPPGPLGRASRSVPVQTRQRGEHPAFMLIPVIFLQENPLFHCIPSFVGSGCLRNRESPKGRAGSVSQPPRAPRGPRGAEGPSQRLGEEPAGCSGLASPDRAGAAEPGNRGASAVVPGLDPAWTVGGQGARTAGWGGALDRVWVPVAGRTGVQGSWGSGTRKSQRTGSFV